MSDTEVLLPPPCGLHWSEVRGTDPAVLDAADKTARFWQDPTPGPVKLGGDRHKSMTWRMFRDTFNPYRPSVIDWPRLDQEARDRLVALPIWDIAVQTEGKAMRRMLAYALTQRDADWRAALEVNAWEESRHKSVLANLVQAYGITLEAEPPYPKPKDTEWAYLVTGFSECVDSFFAFGLFALAEKSGIFPPALVETFEPVMQEECRHILLFANWLAAHRRTMPLWRRPWFEVRVWAVWVFLGWERFGIARGMGDGGKQPDNNFTVSGADAVSAVDVSIGELMRLCLSENDRRFAGYDQRLIRPTTTPFIARVVARFTKG
jgi:hypothetical protein